MKLEDKCLRVGALALCTALFLRLIVPMLGQKLQAANLFSLLLYTSTGRWVAGESVTEETVPTVVEDEPVQAVFAPEDASVISLYNPVGFSVDMQAMLSRPLQWTLATDAPTVLIIHSHASESYQNTEGYQALPNYATLDTQYNMVSIGDHLAAKLEEAGIQTIHDRRLHDHPSYNNAYNNTWLAITDYMEQYPSIQLVLDLHRDSFLNADGSQGKYTAAYKDGQASGLMLVVGSFDNQSESPGWHRNLALAAKLQVQLQRICPGICRPLCLRSDAFNQNLSPQGLLVEVGSAGNTRQEALLAAEVLAEAIIAMQDGSQTVTPVLSPTE